MEQGRQLSAAQCKVKSTLLKHCLDKLHILHKDRMTFAGNALNGNRQKISLLKWHWRGKQASSEGYDKLQAAASA